MALKSEKLSGADKAALLLLGLGEKQAGEILRHLDDGEIQMLGQKISRLAVVPPQRMAAILEEFGKMLETPEAQVVRGGQFFKTSICRTRDDQRQQRLMDKLDLDADPDLFQKIKKLDSRTVAAILRHEHPQTAALILTHLERLQAGQVLAQFPENLQLEVVRRIAGLDQVSPAIIGEIDAALKEEITQAEEEDGRALGGPRSVAEILNRMERATESTILKGLEDENLEDLAREIRGHLFTFEDLLRVQDRGIMTLLQEINHQELALAFKAASQEIKEKFFRNMSEREAEMLRQELETMGPVRLRDAEAAQQNIIQAAKRLEAQGALVLSGKGGEDVFV